MSKRKVPGINWLKGFQYWMSESEAPDSYLHWAAMSAIAGCTERKIDVKWGYHRYYTNQYIILVGPAGIVHKSSTIDQTRNFLREVGVTTASESLTKEELIRQMITRGDGKVSAITALPDELSDFIRPSGPPMIEFLTTIYGCPNMWEYSTRARGIEEMPNAFLNLLGGTTPRWIATEFDATFVEQGFASRTLFVHELEPRFRKARMVISPEMERMRDLLIEDLHHIASMEGTFHWEREAEDWFDEWYEKDLPSELKGVDYRLQSYIARKPTHIIKVAMTLSLAQTDDLIITKDSMIDAKILLDNLEVSMAKTFSAVGRNIYANDLERIYSEILAAPGKKMYFSEITKRNYSAMSKQVLDEQLETLASMGSIQQGADGNGRYYQARG